jgi:UDP-N-acetylmuramate dehydrogenase
LILLMITQRETMNIAHKTSTPLPSIRGRYTENAPLGAVGWFRCGGMAEVLFKPADRDDLAQFLASCPVEIPVTTLGVLSNTIVRDGGVPGVVIRLGREFVGVEVREDSRIAAYSMTPDAHVATTAASAGIAGLEFFSGIPGTIGGALRMNAGCYGTETKDVLVEIEALDRRGNFHVFHPCHPEEPQATKDPTGKGRSFADAQDDRITMTYRHSTAPEDYIFTGAVFQGRPGDSEKIVAHIAQIKAKREASQPIREKTGGSTFANPSPEDIAKAGLPEGTKVWQVIDKAGCRGLTVGGAIMSEMHCNFMINTGTATSADLENLGEEVRRRVYENCEIQLRWEIKRIGEAWNLGISESQKNTFP